MTYDPSKHHRKSIRLRGYDYSQAGLYFITICLQDRKCLFGEILIGANHNSPQNNSPQMKLSDIGKIANACWLEIPEHFPNVVLHDYVVMPNHIHGIVEIVATDLVGAKYFSPQIERQITNMAMPKTPTQEIDNNRNAGAKYISPLRSPSKTIGSIVRGFKIGVTKWVRVHTKIDKLWQRNYWDSIIRDETTYWRISDYIRNNPAKWNNDKFYQNKSNSI